MGESSSSSRRSKADIVDIILSWSYSDITNQDLLKDKVRSIPTEFSSVDHYLESFRYPLIEETRAELSKRFCAISEAPYVGIIVDRRNVGAGSAHEGDTVFSFSLYFAEQRGHYMPRVGDIVLLSTFVPKDLEDLQNVMSLAIVNEVGSGDGRHCKGKLSKFGRKEVVGGGVSYMAVYLINVTDISRLWVSLNVESDDPRVNMCLMKKILCHASLVNSSYVCAYSQIEDIFEQNIINRLNESQIDAVQSVVSDIRCNHLSSVHCISGLPGTGKSEICRIITLAALSLKFKVMVCGPEEFSLVDVTSHFRKLVEGSRFQYVLKDIVVYGENDENPVDVTGVRLMYSPVSKLSSLEEIGSQVVVIVENATRLKECDLIVPLQLKGAQHLILVGDEYDLPTTVSSKLSADSGFGRSLFDRLRLFCRPKQLLNIQYRMHPAVSCFPNKRLFKGQLFDDPSVIDRGHFKYQLPEHIYKAYSFIDINDGKEVVNGHGDDWTNIVEAALVVKIVTKLYHEYVNSRGELSIGVISPYGAQVQTIQDMLPDRIKSNSDFSLWVRSSDEVYSCEMDVIIISTVRCNRTGCVGFGCLPDQSLTSISLTRARHCLWIVGSGTTLVKSQSIWQDLVLDATERDCIFQVGEDKELAGIVLNVKRELDELDDLLNQESLLFKDKIWKIIFSDDFKQSFIALKSLFTKQIVIGFLLRIATGWRPKRRCLYSLKPSLRDFVKLYKVRGLYLVCTIEIISDSQFTQALRIWDILPLVEIPTIVEKLEGMITVCSHYYKERCLKEKRDGKLVVPVSWNICADYAKYNCAPTLTGFTSAPKKLDGLQRSKLSESLLLMKFYSLSSLTVRNLLLASDGKELELPFEVSDVELEVINVSRSAFILGRSGTGKTVVSILKLIRREQEHMDALQGIFPLSNSNYTCSSQSWGDHILQGNGLRQIFVTVSANLCSAVKAYITRLKRCISSSEARGNSEDTEMHEVADNLSMFADIPDSFIDIPQSHFPLVISLQKFLLMLDGSMRCSYFDRFQDLRQISDATRSSVSHAKLQLLRVKEVHYDRFLTSYWPSFNAKYTEKLDPLLVFTQIVSFIKGGCRLGKVAKHEKMNEEEYVSLTGGMSTKENEKRKMIYKIFLDYEKKKLYNGEYDISDLVIDIHRRLRTEGYGGTLIHFIYIDEVQDFSLSQLSLFKYISCNVQEGFVFSGDTAQTITKGINFRFEDIRSMFYTEFLNRLEKPEHLFHLYQNFRTHSSVLKLAQSVLTMLNYFFPCSFDKLESETSILQGEVPLLLESCEENVLKNIFCSTTGNTDGLVTFGAQQVILVRDDNVKKQVIEQIGSSALVLTILECKGLEFQDVLLYNFFEKSPLRNKWRVIYNYMADKNILGSSTVKYPKFDPDLHGALCAELKELYVAITRTRQRFWIFEKSSIAEPLFVYWKKLGVVNQGELDLSFSDMQVFCKPEEWNLRGQKFFNEGDYRTASFCFKRSGDVFRSNWAKAAALQMDGENNIRRDFEFASKCLTEAAELYERIGKFESVATCSMTLGDYAKASEIYLKKFLEPRYEDAGDCLAIGGLWSDAANTYAKGNCLLKCMSACRNGELFELGWVLLKKWPRIDVTNNKVRLLNDWISKINKNSDIKSVTGVARYFPEDAYSFLLEKGKYVEASTLQRLMGNTLAEAKVFERAQDYHKSSQLVVFHIAVKLLIGEKSRVTEAHSLEVLLEKAKELSYEVSNSYGRSKCAELDFLTDSSCRLSNILVHIQKAQNYSNAVMETFAARKVIELYLKLDIGGFHHDPDTVFKWKSRLLEKLFFEGQSSAQVLLRTWNIWMKRISCLFSYLQGSVNPSDHEEYTDLCQKYFLVLKLSGRDVYVAFDRHGTWLTGANDQALYQVDSKVYLSGRVFKSLAQHFLREEVSSLCDRLLQMVKQIQLDYQQKKFTFIQNAVLALQISGILKFVALYGSNTRKISGLLNWLQKAFFPLCYSDSMLSAKTDSDLQDKDTAMKAVGLVLYSNLNSLNSGAMPTRMAWAIAFLFFNSTFVEELTWEIRNKYGLNHLWKPFYEELLSFKYMEHKDALSLGQTFLDAMQPTDPHTQLLLLENLLFLTSSCQIGRGWFITTKLTLSKTLFSNDSEASQYALSGPSWPVVAQESIKHLYDFILAVACEILTKRRFIWAKRYDRQALHFHQSLILRLVSILSLVCLNSGGHFVPVQEILKKAAGSLFLLPPCVQLGLWNVMKGRMRSRKIFGFLFSKALGTIDNRLVLICRDDYREYRGFAMHLKPIIVNTSFLSQKKEIQNLLMCFNFQS